MSTRSFAVLRRVVGAAGAVLLATGGAVVTAPPVFADTIRSQQWYLSAMDVATAQAGGAGDGVTVAVIDSGVDGTHPDLTGSVLKGVNASTDSGDGQQDPVGHGTGMAAIIAGHGHGAGSADGVLGIAPKAKILPIGLESANLRDRFDPDKVAHAIDLAVQRGAKVISAAFDTYPTDAVQAAVRRALDANVVVVAAVPNARPDGLDVIGAPASFSGVVAVCGVDRAGNHASFSVPADDSAPLTICAPAVDGVSAKPGGGYDTGRFGTSMACAIVTGAVALIRSKYPTMPAYEVVHRLTATAVDKGDRGRDKLYGFGNLNLVAAVTGDVSPTTSPTPWIKRSAGPSSAAPTVSAPAVAGPSTGGGGGSGRLVAAGVGGAAVVLVVVGLLVVLRRRRATGPS